MKDCYHIQSDIVKQHLTFTTWRDTVYLGIKSRLQVCFRKITEVVGWICISDKALRIIKKKNTLNYALISSVFYFSADYYSVIKLRSAGDSFWNSTSTMSLVLEGCVARILRPVHQEWGHSLSATASSLFCEPASITATALMLHSVAVVVGYGPSRIYLPFMFWVVGQEGQLPGFIAEGVLDEIRMPWKNLVERANQIPAIAYSVSQLQLCEAIGIPHSLLKKWDAPTSVVPNR